VKTFAFRGDFFFRKKETKKRALSQAIIIFSNYDIKEFSEIGNSRGHFRWSFRSCHALQALASSNKIKYAKP